MTKQIKLYYNIGSNPSRSSLLTIAAIDLDVEKILVNFMVGEHMQPEFLKKNPLHTVPVLEDGDFTLFDSHAINAYLVGKYGKNDSLYPKDLQKRAVVDQRLHFESGVLFPRIAAVVYALFAGTAKTIEKSKTDQIFDGYKSLEILFGDHNYAAGNDLTIADFSLATTISNSNAAILPVDKEAFPKISAWLSRMESLPYYKVNETGTEAFKAMVQSLLG